MVRTLDKSGKDEIGITGQAGVGMGPEADLHFRVYYQVSNATELDQLEGPFDQATVTLDIGVGATVDVFWNGNQGGGPSCAYSCGQAIYGIDAGVDLGAGVGGSFSVTYTWVHKLRGFSALAARTAWDMLSPGLSIGYELGRARHAISVAKRQAVGSMQALSQALTNLADSSLSPATC